jgi:hypothetical protein
VNIKIRLSHEEIVLLQTYSLERVLSSLMNARTKGDLQTVKEDVRPIRELASRLWYAASGESLQLEETDK